LEDTYFEFEVTQEKELIKSLLKALEDYASLTLVMEFQWNRSMSSGESCYLRLFSRLYDEILELKKFNKITDKIYAPILIDEVDLYLHPDWQCKWFYRFIKGLEIMQEKTGVELKLQLIMTTHSPFMLTDFISDNIARIAREYGHTINRSESSDSDNFMVGNIYDILKDGFFLDGTMGLFIEKKLKKILAHPTILSEQDKFVIDHIGDALIRSLILNKVGGVND
jgi:predicted ATP-dependent endonuclease of OLD family